MSEGSGLRTHIGRLSKAAELGSRSGPLRKEAL